MNDKHRQAARKRLVRDMFPAKLEEIRQFYIAECYLLGTRLVNETIDLHLNAFEQRAELLALGAWFDQVKGVDAKILQEQKDSVSHHARGLQQSLESSSFFRRARSILLEHDSLPLRAALLLALDEIAESPEVLALKLPKEPVAFDRFAEFLEKARPTSAEGEFLATLPKPLLWLTFLVGRKNRDARVIAPLMELAEEKLEYLERYPGRLWQIVIELTYWVRCCGVVVHCFGFVGFRRMMGLLRWLFLLDHLR